MINEIALSVSSEALCSKWALNLWDDVLIYELSWIFWVSWDDVLIYELSCIFCVSAGLADILFYDVITATFTVSDSVLTETVFSIS